MSDAAIDERDKRGDWRPAQPITLPPIHLRPFKSAAAFKWFIGFPGFLWPLNAFWLGLTLITWVWLTPPLQEMIAFEPWWIALVLARNIALTTVLFGGTHLYLYVFRKQGDHLKFSNRPLATGTRRFLFRSQVRDNIFRSLVYGITIYSGFEVITLWAFANGYLGLFELGSPLLFWGWFVALLILAPAIHALHFYWGHRLLHVRFVYRTIHAVHHRNVEVGPWSGLAMHPIEHAIYFSTVVVQWLLALHPVNALFQLQITIFYALMAHTGFEKILIGRLSIDNNSYFHYLHHKYFECNYGGGLVPFDWLFNTAHDGTEKAHIRMRKRMKERHSAAS
jgi:sterol desaturase/sphingolipid hydroxylase (fatty acid hydroxylase superfamily)